MSGQKKAGAPAVQVDKSGGRVRVRNLSYALEGTIVTQDKEIRYRLEPNKWTTVPEEVYSLLHSKFSQPQEYEVPDWEMGEHVAQKTPRMETPHSEFIMEFSGDKE